MDCPRTLFPTTTIPGSCTQTMRPSGSFTGTDSWSGTLALSFTGPDCDCFGGLFGAPCVDQTVPVSATR